MQLVIFTLMMVAGIFADDGNETEIHEYEEEHILSEILADYDRRVLPTRDGSAVEVEVRVHIIDMAQTQPIHSHYGMEIILHCFWNDHRLTYNGSKIDDIRLAGNKVDLIWTPDFTFEAKIGIASKITMDNKFASIDENGDILFSQRVILTLFCPMDFRNFPFDDQDCTLPILSSAYNDEQMTLEWMTRSGATKKPGLVFRTNPSEMEGIFKVGNFTQGKIKRRFGMGEVYDQLTANFHLHRRFNYYFVRIYLPMMLIVILSFGAFWIDYRSTPARTIMATTIVLTAMVFIVSIQGSLPPTTSIRSVDIYSLSCFMFVFATLVEFALVQTMDIQVRIMEREHKEFLRKQSEAAKPHSSKRPDDGNSIVRHRPTSSSSVSPENVKHSPLTGNSGRGCFGRLVNRIYEEHLKHREEYHVLDQISKRVFPTTFIVMNAIYFAVYTIK